MHGTYKTNSDLHCSSRPHSFQVSGLYHLPLKFPDGRQKLTDPNPLSLAAVNLQPPTWCAGRAHLHQSNMRLLGRQTFGPIWSCARTRTSAAPQQEETTTRESAGASSVISAQIAPICARRKPGAHRLLLQDSFWTPRLVNWSCGVVNVLTALLCESTEANCN